MSPTFSHLSADFVGALPSQLGDASLSSGVLIAGAGAAGFSAVGAPVVRKLPGDAVSAVLLLNDCHMSAHTFPSDHLMLLDILTLSTHDPQGTKLAQLGGHGNRRRRRRSPTPQSHQPRRPVVVDG